MVIHLVTVIGSGVSMFLNRSDQSEVICWVWQSPLRFPKRWKPFCSISCRQDSASVLEYLIIEEEKPQKPGRLRASWWLSVKRTHMRAGDTGFNPWSQEDPTCLRQLVHHNYWACAQTWGCNYWVHLLKLARAASLEKSPPSNEDPAQSTINKMFAKDEINHLGDIKGVQALLTPCLVRQLL